MTQTVYAPGSPVRLSTPDLPRLDGAAATVVAVEDWGCHVTTEAAATGRFRAAWDELRPAESSPGVDRVRATRVHQAKESGFTGDACDACGSFMMVRNGSCLKCDSCGATTGCS